jgi:carboxypeptidase C (cathepsin A)
VKRILGVPESHNYSRKCFIMIIRNPVTYLNNSVISWDVNRAFMRTGDVTHDASSMASELVESGIRILNVAGDADFVCNFMVRHRNFNG